MPAESPGLASACVLGGGAASATVTTGTAATAELAVVALLAGSAVVAAAPGAAVNGSTPPSVGLADSTVVAVAVRAFCVTAAALLAPFRDSLLKGSDDPLEIVRQVGRLLVRERVEHVARLLHPLVDLLRGLAAGVRELHQHHAPIGVGLGTLHEALALKLREKLGERLAREAKEERELALRDLGVHGEEREDAPLPAAAFAPRATIGAAAPLHPGLDHGEVGEPLLRESARIGGEGSVGCVLVVCVVANHAVPSVGVWAGDLPARLSGT